MSYGSTNLLASNLKKITLEQFQELSLERKEEAMKLFVGFQEAEEIFINKDKKIPIEDFHPMTDANHAVFLFQKLMSRQIPFIIGGDCWYNGEGLNASTGEKPKRVFENRWNYYDAENKYVEYNFIQKFCETICIAYLIIEDYMEPLTKEEKENSEKSKQVINKMINSWS